jgi:hypothetical protein
VPHLPSPSLPSLQTPVPRIQAALLRGLLLFGALAVPVGALAVPVGALAVPVGAGEPPLPVPVVAAGEIGHACVTARRAGDLQVLPGAQARLRASLPLRPTLDQAIALAEAMLACGAPDAALAALARVSPAPGPERRRWLEMQWRAAHSGLHHDLAAQSLRLLAEGDPARLETLLLPVGWSQEGREPPRRAAIDLLADHLESLHEDRLAAEVLLGARSPGALRAARWGRAAALAHHLPAPEREALFERALEQAAAAQAWGLVAALLDQQLAAGVVDEASRRALERRLRLGARIDDAYGEWVQRRRQPDAAADLRLQELEGQLRSPRASDGHASPVPPDSPAPVPPLGAPSPGTIPSHSLP